MNNLNPLFENIAIDCFKCGAKKTYKNRSDIKKYVIKKWKNYKYNKDNEDKENDK